MRVLFLGAPVDDIPADIDFKSRFERTGRNTGNLLIGYGLKKQIDFTHCHYGQGIPPEAVNEQFDLIAIPAANFIFKGFDFGYMADYLEKTTLPILCVGIGAQMPSSANPEMEIPEGSQRLLKILGERCVDIGVRGDFTADVLSRMGIKNTTITGCPSYYSNLSPQIEIRRPEFNPFFRISVNGSRNVTDHSFDPESALYVESELLRLAQRYRYDYVLQNETPELEILATGQLSSEQYGNLVSLSKRHGLRISPEHYAAFITAHCKSFYAIDDWSAFIKTKDFSIGSRFHGNLIALLNGVASVLFAHDSRTVEMAKFMKIPHHSVQAIGYIDFRSLYEEADFESFSKAYSENYSRYIAFMERNHVKHHLSG